MERLLNDRNFIIIYNILRFIYCFILVFYLFFLIVENVSYNTSIFGYRVFVVASDSSSMTCSSNDVILIEDIDGNNLKILDKVVVSEKDNGLDGLLMIREIVDVQNKNDKAQYFVNDISDKNKNVSIDNSLIVGKVVGYLKFVSLIGNIFQNQLSFFLLVFLPLVLIIIIEILRTHNFIKMEQNNINERLKRVYYCKRKINNKKLIKTMEKEFCDEEII